LIYSPHTFELSLILNTDNFCKWKSEAYKKAEGKHRVYPKNGVLAYIKVLHNIGKVKGFGPKYAKDDDRINPDLSSDLEGNSNGVEFTAYDKEAESKQKKQKVFCAWKFV